MNEEIRLLEERYDYIVGKFIGEYEPVTECSSETGGGEFDYIGVSACSKRGTSPEVRVYRATDIPHDNNACSDLIDLLVSRNMIRRYETVFTRDRNLIRFDIALQQRTDENMEAVFSQMRKQSEEFTANESEIRKAASMKITDAEESRYAALYHIGLAQNRGGAETGGNGIEGIKFYCLTRWCDNPAALEPGNDFRDQYFMEKIIDNLGADDSILFTLADNMLNNGLFHLWMFGIDIGKQNRSKRKIYLKSMTKDPAILTVARNTMQDMLSSDKPMENLTENSGILQRLKKKTETILQWSFTHEELECRGIAIGIDEKKELYLNVYYTWNTEQGFCVP